MKQSVVTLSVPAEADFARTVRMTASNLAVVCGMNVDEVDDVRMAAEEGFVYACATSPDVCDITVTLDEGAMSFDFSLGEGDPEASQEGASLDLAELMLSAVCDEHGVSQDGKTLHVRKLAGVHGE